MSPLQFVNLTHKNVVHFSYLRKSLSFQQILFLSKYFDHALPRVSNIFFLAGIVDILKAVGNVMTINIRPSKKWNISSVIWLYKLDVGAKRFIHECYYERSILYF